MKQWEHWEVISYMISYTISYIHVVYDAVSFPDIIGGLFKLEGGKERRQTGYACPTLSQDLDL
jgi:hypothetical protein